MNTAMKDCYRKGDLVMKNNRIKRPLTILIIVVILFALGIVLNSLQSCKNEEVNAKSEVPRISLEQARQNTLSGESLFVCAYEDDAKCNKIRLDRGISLTEFESKLSDVSKEREIIFYCS